ncbi:MAG: hypothetical protein ACYT04_28455 [Nostoc sp.]
MICVHSVRVASRREGYPAGTLLYERLLYERLLYERLRQRQRQREQP